MRNQQVAKMGIKTQNLILGKTILLLSLLAFSCGVKKTSVSEDASEGRNEDRLPPKNEHQSFHVTEASKLPECKEAREGAIAFIKTSKIFKVCEGGAWNDLDLGNTSPAPSGTPCAISKTGLMSSITCGQSSVSIQDGLSANGAACSVSKTGSLATITCGSQSVSIADGSQGPEGAAGASCSVSKAGGVATIVCGSQAVQVVDGVSGASCSVTKIGSVATVVCGGQSVTLTDGSAGSQGPQGLQGLQGLQGNAGFNSLIDFVSEPAGSNCLAGGTKFISGLDNGDSGGVARNGTLESGEIDTFRYLCKDPSSYAVAGQKLFSGSAFVGTIMKRFLTWKKDYNESVLVPSDELFLISNAAGTAKTLHRATRVNSTLCSGRAGSGTGDVYAVYETCADSDTQLTAHTELSGFSKFYATNNCTGVAYVGKSGSFYLSNNPVNFDQSGFLNFVASQGTDVHFKSGTEWMRLTANTSTNMVARSAGTIGSCVMICSNSDYCSSGSSNNGANISAFPFSTATESAVGISFIIPAGWKTY